MTCSILSLEAQEALDRMDQIATIWRVFGDLITPVSDMHIVNRDDLSSALYFLTSEYHKAREAFSQSIKGVHHVD